MSSLLVQYSRPLMKSVELKKILPGSFTKGPEKKLSQKESNLPTIIFHGRAVKLRGCNTNTAPHSKHEIAWLTLTKGPAAKYLEFQDNSLQLAIPFIRGS